MNGKTGVCMCVCVCVHYDRLVYRISYNRVVHTVYSGYYNIGGSVVIWWTSKADDFFGESVLVDLCWGWGHSLVDCESVEAVHLRSSFSQRGLLSVEARVN